MSNEEVAAELQGLSDGALEAFEDRILDKLLSKLNTEMADGATGGEGSRSNKTGSTKVAGELPSECIGEWKGLRAG